MKTIHKHIARAVNGASTMAQNTKIIFLCCMWRSSSVAIEFAVVSREQTILITYKIQLHLLDIIDVILFYSILFTTTNSNKFSIHLQCRSSLTSNALYTFE